MRQVSSFLKLFFVFCVLAAFTTGCNNQTVDVAEAAFDNPEVGVFIQNQEKLINEFFKSAKQGKSISQFSELAKIEALSNAKRKELLKNMSDADRRKYMAFMKRLGKQVQKYTREFSVEHAL